MLKSNPCIVLVTRETRLKKLMDRYAVRGLAMFKMAKDRELALERRADRARELGEVVEAAASLRDTADEMADFEEYEEEDRTYQDVVSFLRRELDVGHPVKVIDRSLLPTHDFWDALAVVCVGQDGLVANTAKYVGSVPVVGINPDPQRIDGILLPFAAGQAREIIQRLLKNRAKVRHVTLAAAKLSDGQEMLAFNDLFIGCASHVSARYILRTEGGRSAGQRAETQSSSGLLVSTGAGSTGWLSSLYNMMAGFAQFAGGQPAAQPAMTWEDRRLAWAVREPFRSRSTGASLVAGVLEEADELVVESLMPAGGVIFSDGIEADHLTFTSGMVARIAVAKQQANLVVE